MDDKGYLDILKKFWGYDSFRSIQLDIIRSVGSGRDTLGLMPTGGGKSITFQVPALAMDGVCIVVTPLLALMKDQVQTLRKKGILAHAVNSSLTHDQMLAAYDNCIFAAAKFLYLSPERLSTELFLLKLKQMRVSMLVVDEAHCISQWGYDFRPSYLKIAEVRKLMPNVPVLALTATATPRVADDIMSRLEFRHPNLFSMSFARHNLAYVVRVAEDKEQQMVRILRSVPGSAIVYVRSRKRTADYAAFLRSQGFSAGFFHAGLSVKEKDKRQEEWTKGDMRVIVCTNAFGMGIDKPDVRVVIHIDPPESIEAYFQEAGRAGRDGLKSYAVLLWSDADAAKLRRNVTTRFPPIDFVVNVYNSICNARQVGLGEGEGHVEEFNLEKFCKETSRQIAQTAGALAILEAAGYMAFQPNVQLQSRLMFRVERGRLYGVEEAYPHLATVIKAVLRSYTGIFMEYAVIDEERIALLSALTRQEVYEKLLELDRIGVVSYNPQKQTEFITWMRDREHERYMVFPKSVYDDRLADASRRIESMISYCTNGEVCRSRHLLEYFGETESEDCGQCDVCIERKKNKRDAEVVRREVEALVKARLANGPLPYEAARCVEGHDPRVVAEVIRSMVDDDILALDVRNILSLND